MARNHINLAGEFYVMHSLFRKGYDPALTLGNTKGVDILLYNQNNNKQFKVEVKTTTELKKNEKLFGGRNINWRMDKKHESMVKSNLIYCFVFLPSVNALTPRIFLIPSFYVAHYVKYEHDLWERTPHRKPIKPDITMRCFRILLKEPDDSENLSLGWLNENYSEPTKTEYINSYKVLLKDIQRWENNFEIFD